MTRIEFGGMLTKYLSRWQWADGEQEILFGRMARLSATEFEAGLQKLLEQHETHFKPTIASILRICGHERKATYQSQDAWGTDVQHHVAFAACRKVAECKTNRQLAEVYAGVMRDFPGMSNEAKARYEREVVRLTAVPDSILGSVAMGMAGRATASDEHRQAVPVNRQPAPPDAPTGYHDVPDLPPAVYGEIIPEIGDDDPSIPF